RPEQLVALYGIDDGVEAAQDIADGKGARDQIDPPPDAAPRLTLLALFRIHAPTLPITLAPPRTRSPRRTRTATPGGSIRSTREPNLISPIRDPRSTLSPGFTQQTMRRAIRPAICLQTT